jgi:acetyltransferase-like isoleucine patch superfamily enzyme
MVDAARPRLRASLKRGIDWCCRALLAPCALTCRIGGVSARETAFLFWAQTFALVPGVPGVFLRRAFYHWTLLQCAESFFIGFGAFFSNSASIVEQDVYVGPYAIVGAAHLGRGCLIGSRASIISGTNLHQLDAQGRWLPTDSSQLQITRIGEYAWIGEAAIVMHDIGHGAMVAAGAVVASRVPAGIVVAGNPARFVRHLQPQATEEVKKPEVAVATN